MMTQNKLKALKQKRLWVLFHLLFSQILWSLFFSSSLSGSLERADVAAQAAEHNVREAWVAMHVREGGRATKQTRQFCPRDRIKNRQLRPSDDVRFRIPKEFKVSFAL